MKFALKFSMPKWERPKPEAPYISNPLINELEKVDFVSLTAERRQDILHRLKLACADIAEDRRHQPAILSDRIRLQKMWQDYFRIAQTTPAGDNQGETLSVSRYSEMQEEQKPRALGAVMTMQEELVAAANFKIDMGGLDINDMDDFDDFSPSSIPRVAPPPPPPQQAHAPAPHAAAAHVAASHHLATAASDTAEAKPTSATVADAELAEQMAKIKAVAPIGLPPMSFPNDPAPEHTHLAVEAEPDFRVELTQEEAALRLTADQELAEQMEKVKAVAPIGLPPMAFPSDPVTKQAESVVEPEAVFSVEMTQDEAEPPLSAEDELAEQMAKIKAVAPMALPPMAFPSDPVAEHVAIAPEPETALSLEISPPDSEADSIEELSAHDHDEELAEHMAKIQAVAPIALPPMPHPADTTEAAEPASEVLHVIPHEADAHPDIPLAIEDTTLHIHDGHLEETASAAAIIDADVVESEAVTVVKAAEESDASGFRPLTIAVIEDEPEELKAETVIPDEMISEVVPAEEIAPQAVDIPVETPVAMATIEDAGQPVEVEPVAAPIAVEAEKPAEPKPKRSRKASALATLRSMLSSTSANDKPATQETAVAASEPDTAVPEASSDAQEALADAPEADQPNKDEIEAALPPKEREVSATPSTKEWVNIKLLRPSVIRGLPLPDQVITIVPYTEAKRLEENGSAIILTKPRTPRSTS